MSTKPNIPEEEVDFGNLFSQIGKMFNNFFNFIGNIFKSIYHLLILFILFVRKNIVKLGLATLIGVIVGVILDLNRKPVFKSATTVEVAHGSGDRLYSQINYLNNLISFEDSARIGKIFGIEPREAASLTEFDVDPIDSQKNMYLDYDNYLQNTDTIYTFSREFTYQDFLKRKTDTDLRYHKITAQGYNPYVFLKLNEGIKTLVENAYYEDLREKKVKELSFERDKLKEHIAQIDSLRKRYKETAYLQFQERAQENSGVSFRTVSAGYKGNVDKDLYYVSDTLMLKLREVNKQLVDNETILKQQSEFTIGEDITNLLSKNWIKFGLFGFGIMLLVLLSMQFNKYLNKYENQI